MMRRSNAHGSEDGASSVEFAIILPVLLLIVFGTIQFGIVFGRIQSLEAAAREGARLASIGAPTSEITQRVRESQNLFDEDDVVVTVVADSPPAGDPPCGAVGQIVEVTAVVPPSDEYALTIPLVTEQQ